MEFKVTLEITARPGHILNMDAYAQVEARLIRNSWNKLDNTALKFEKNDTFEGIVNNNATVADCMRYITQNFRDLSCKLGFPSLVNSSRTKESYTLNYNFNSDILIGTFTFETN